MKVFYATTLWFFVLCAIAQAGTTGKITGQVTDAFGVPLPGAAVVIEANNRGTETDEEGIYFLLSIEPGRHTLVAHMIGYESVQKTEVLVTSDFTTNVSFALKEQALELGEMVVEAQAGSEGGSMFSLRSFLPAVEADKTTSKFVVRGEDIEALPLIRDMAEFIELQAGVTVDEEGDEISVRAGEPEDIAYYVDGIVMPTTDHAHARVYRNFNRLAIQEMTIVTGGLDAEYGNAQGGVVNVVTKEGSLDFNGLIDYQFTPSGQKHWGENVYDSPIHRGKNRWDDPNWVAETVTLPDGREVRSHERVDYTSEMGHFLEGNVSGPLMKDTAFFLSSRWRREPSAFPTAHLHTPPNLSNTLKVTHRYSDAIKVRFGGLYDWRETGNPGGPEVGGQRNLGDSARNLFLAVPNPAGDFRDVDQLYHMGVTHMLSTKTFYDVRVGYSTSSRDTIHTVWPTDASHISEIHTQNPIKDQKREYTIFRQVVDWERFERKRLSLNIDFSSQVNRQHFVKAGFEALRYDNWYQAYFSTTPIQKSVFWYGKTYNDTDFFTGQQNKGLNPVQLGIYLQDKIEMDGFIVNAGLRYDVFLQNTRVADPLLTAPNSAMWNSMTRNRLIPHVRGPAIKTLSPRLGITHPLTEKAVLRFYYGRAYQLPRFRDLFWNRWETEQTNAGIHSDNDLNGNGVIDPSERWNTFGDHTLNGAGMQFANDGNRFALNNIYLLPPETISFEVGVDWNFWHRYIFGFTTYYKNANNQIGYGGGAADLSGFNRTGTWIDPAIGNIFGDRVGRAMNRGFLDTRGVELSLKKQFSQMFAFSFALNFQWAEQIPGGKGVNVIPDSLFVANGHFWTTYDVDPATGAEIPVSLQEMALREGRDAEYYIQLYGHQANENIRLFQRELLAVGADRNAGIPSDWDTRWGYHATDPVVLTPGTRLDGFYDASDHDHWEQVNAQPNYPGHGEGNVMVMRTSLSTMERSSILRDRRTFGSMAFLIATPSGWGPWQGRLGGNLRANLVYRLFTGTPFEYPRRVLDIRDESGIEEFFGAIHTRVDLNVEKRIGNVAGAHVMLGLEVFNLMNQKDVRSVAASIERGVDFDGGLWVNYGIENFDPITAAGEGTPEFNDVNNYWDQPRELKFNVRFKW